MWLYQVFRLTLLSDPELGGVPGDAVTPGVMAGPGASLRFLEETSPAPPHGFGLTGRSLKHCLCVQVFS